MGFNNVTGPLLLEFYTCSQGSVIELITLSIGQSGLAGGKINFHDS